MTINSKLDIAVPPDPTAFGGFPIHQAVLTRGATQVKLILMRLLILGLHFSVSDGL